MSDSGPRVVLPWMPLYVSNILGSDEYNAMQDFQQAWYLNLLMRAWDNTKQPAYLENDPKQLYQQANARTERFFLKNANSVLACFRVSADGLWLYNPKQVTVYEDQLRTYWRRRPHELRKALGTNNLRESCAPLIYGFDSCLDSREEVSLIDSNQAAAMICVELGIGGMEKRAIAKESVLSYMKINSTSAEKAAEDLVALRLRYEQEVTGQFQQKASTFFAEGTWRNPDTWRQQDGARVSNSRQTERFDHNAAVLAADGELLAGRTADRSPEQQDGTHHRRAKGLAAGAE